MAKFKKKHWQILKYYCEGWKGELHHLVKGQKEEAFCIVQLMTVDDHGVATGHAKNWHTGAEVPNSRKESNLAFWKKVLSKDDYHLFCEDGLAWA